MRQVDYVGLVRRLVSLDLLVSAPVSEKPPTLGLVEFQPLPIVGRRTVETFRLRVGGLRKEG